MSIESCFEILKNKTESTCLMWKDVHGYAPDKVANILDSAMLEWQIELTDALEIWIDKGLNMTNGELILARVNLGAVVESWLRFFYTIYREEYDKDPVKRKNKNLSPENTLTFDDMVNYSTGILWDDETSEDYRWLNSIRNKRNAIHAFMYRDIGTPTDFLNDIVYMCHFVELLCDRFPPIEEFDAIFYEEIGQYTEYE